MLKLKHFMLASMTSALIAPALSVGAQDTVTVTPLVFENSVSTGYFPAPDGRHLLYETDEPEPGLMLVDQDGENEPLFIALPQENGETIAFPLEATNHLNRVSWSPDSTRFVVAGTDYHHLKEGDLWLYTLEGAGWTNLTEDAYGPTDLMKIIQGELDFEMPITNEMQPAWSPDGGQIAFERYQGWGGRPYQTTISVIDLDSGEIRDLAPFPQRSPESNTMGSAGALSWTTDGTGIYVVTMGTDIDGNLDGLYRLDIATSALDQLLSYNEIMQTYTDTTGQTPDYRVWTNPITVSPDGARLLMWVGSPGDSTTFRYWPFVYDIARDALSPLLSFREWENPPGTGMTNFLPLYAAWSPDSESILLAARVPQNQNDLPVLVDAVGNLMLTRYDIITGGAESFGLLNWTGVGSTTAVWASSGDILLADYHLRLP